jgi:hypothetical protein
MNTNLYQQAFYNIVDKCEEVTMQYMSKRPQVDEMCDWSKEDLRYFLLEIIDCVEMVDYALHETLNGQDH